VHEKLKIHLVQFFFLLYYLHQIQHSHFMVAGPQFTKSFINYNFCFDKRFQSSHNGAIHA
jgi:hypothetical protein